MFLGSYTPSFNKLSRRIALPKKLRDQLSTNEIILSYGFEKCIFGFDIKAWEKESAKQLSESITTRGARDIRRFFFSAAQFVKFDDQGRFVIPSNLYQYSQIKNPIIAGCGDHFEIWDKVKWQEYQSQLQKSK